MVTSKEWTSSAYVKEAKAKQFVDQVLDSGFWSKCVDVVKPTEPLVRVLRIVDSEDKPAMGILYKSIVKAREEMVRRFQRNKKKVDPYLKILDKRWDSQLRKNLHVIGYWLNPACRYNDVEFEKHTSTTSELLDVIEKHANGNSELQLKLTDEMRIFKDGELDFGRKSTVDERCIVRADQWWKTYGTCTPTLQRLGIRILSQTCSASGCERNWSIFEHIHSKKRNRLEHQKLNDLVFVRYNLRLQNRKIRNGSYDPINIEIIADHSSWVLEDSPPLLTNEELEALRNDLANMTIQPVSSDIDQIDLDGDEDGDMGNAQDTIVDTVNQEKSNTREDEVGGEDIKDNLGFQLYLESLDLFIVANYSYYSKNNIMEQRNTDVMRKININYQFVADRARQLKALWRSW
ncbi:unnamed protein product [Vicia faba]|uniref:HAT C-terminal dimerisation domain-containing protein n=1 Tax=Vicia faba TaxID=3906 RepID=A0AAV0YQI3_VICFA|nr:unnamed protein product [Vicia faba]